jgi:hypothetical protein
VSATERAGGPASAAWGECHVRAVSLSRARAAAGGPLWQQLHHFCGPGPAARLPASAWVWFLGHARAGGRCGPQP